MDIELGKANIGSTEKASSDSNRELQYAKEDMDRRGEFFVAESLRRDEDN